MLTSHHVLPEPDRLTIGADGVLTGRTGQYVKVLRDLAGVYHDAYAIISRAGGMAQLVVSDDAGGWTTRPNPNHVGYRPVTA